MVRGVLVLTPEEQGLKLLRDDRVVGPWLTRAVGRPMCVVNLERVSIVSSAGLASLVILRRTLAKRAGLVRVSGASPDVMRLIEFTKLHYFFDFDATVDDSVDRLLAEAAA